MDRDSLIFVVYDYIVFLWSWARYPYLSIIGSGPGAQIWNGMLLNLISSLYLDPTRILPSFITPDEVKS